MNALRARGWGQLAGVLLALLLLMGAQPPTSEKPLVLLPATPAFTPTLFTIKQVRDERPGRPAVAWLLPATPPVAASPARAVELQGGTEAALRQFVARTLPARPARYGVTMRVRECRVQETAVGTNQAAGQISLHLAFDWVNPEGRTITLTEYRGGARYLRPLANRAVVEPTLRQALVGSLAYFNTWLTRAAAHDVRLATAVHPTFRYYTRQTEPDTVFYDPARPLTWADFTGQPRPKGRYAASVFPSFAYQGRPRVVNGVIELDMILKIFVVRSSSWVDAGQQTAEHLNHEQRHFDIVRLVAERFRRKATPDSLTVEDYNSILQLQYLKSFTEMNHIQEQYDAETHGSPLAQERWNRRIDEELRQYGIIP
ncbi:lytic polysaccharide monooxygenase [Hymenobacter glacieicola]|nr:lytic polysaccharide monooxygenase [Hymenobacter glacieicola]